MPGLTGWHLLAILAIVLLFFGAPKLPALAKSIGQSMRIFKGEVKSMQEDGKKPDDSAADADAPRQVTDEAVSSEPSPKK